MTDREKDVPAVEPPKETLDRRAFFERFGTAAGLAAATTVVLASTAKADCLSGCT